MLSLVCNWLFWTIGCVSVWIVFGFLWMIYEIVFNCPILPDDSEYEELMNILDNDDSK